MRFEKWHGIGNDFLLVREQDLAHEQADGSPFVATGDDGRPRLDDAAVVAACDRHFGVGGDGILVLGDSADADARMLIHNADGSMAEMCGNGIRVAARFLVERDIVSPGAGGTFTIETAAGPIRPTLLDDGRVRVDMGPVSSSGELDVDLATVDGELAGRSLRGMVVDVGNPHFVVRRNPDGPDLHRIGPLVERHPAFPLRTNVEFYVAGDADGEVRMRVWERGVGETLACGTGACAVAFAALADGVVDGDVVTVHLPGGVLEVCFEGERAIMTGAAHHAWTGALDLERVVAGMPTAAATA